MTNTVKPYKKEYDYSYTSGAYATVELIKTRPEAVRCVYRHSAFSDEDSLIRFCAERNIPCVLSDRAFSVVNQKENSYVLGVFSKYKETLKTDKPHIVLVNPADMGNLGTIVRTMAGFGFKDLAIVEPAADVFAPKTIRAGMGALFHIRHACFRSFEEYERIYFGRDLFPFMLNGSAAPEDCIPKTPFSLIFGNEATGLDDRFKSIGQSVKIPLSDNIDSFNLAVAAGIGMYVFRRQTSDSRCQMPDAGKRV